MVRGIKKKIILDTNFLMIPGTLKVDVESEINRACEFNHEICVLDKSIDELKKISETGKGKEKRAAKTGLALIRRKGFKVIKTASYGKELDVDSILVEEAKKGAIVATQDAGLKKRLKKIKVPYITLRQKKYVVIVY